VPFAGGLSPSPERGGGGIPTLQRIIESLGSQLGSAYDITTTSGLVYIELEAYARAIWGAWQDNERLGNQWQASRMSDFLPRWEAIYAIVPSPTDTLPARRARIAVLQARAGQANQQVLTDSLNGLLGSVLVTIVNGNSATANVWTPSTWPFGQHDPSNAVDWYSTVAFVAIQVTKPTGWSEGDLYTAIAGIGPVLDSALPAWVTWTWFRQDIHGSPGFFLDEGGNLDNEAFRV